MNNQIFALAVLFLIGNLFAEDLGKSATITNATYKELSNTKIAAYSNIVYDKSLAIIATDTVKNPIDLPTNTFKWTTSCEAFTCEVQVEIVPSKELMLEKDFIKGLADRQEISFDMPFIREAVNKITEYCYNPFIPNTDKPNTSSISCQNITTTTYKENTDISQIKEPTTIILRAHRANALIKTDLGFSIFGQERWDAAIWNSTGGTMTYDGIYTVVTFTGNGTFGVTGDTPINATVLVVAGGGAGGSKTPGNAGGGGAGGLIYNASYNATGNITVTVGIGGARSETLGGNGANSSFGTLMARGGGGGGYYDDTPNWAETERQGKAPVVETHHLTHTVEVEEAVQQSRVQT
jgi:hypothetical protein